MAARGAAVAAATCSVAEWSEQSAGRREPVSVGVSVCRCVGAYSCKWRLSDNGGSVVVMRE